MSGVLSRQEGALVSPVRGRDIPLNGLPTEAESHQKSELTGEEVARLDFLKESHSKSQWARTGRNKKRGGETTAMAIRAKMNLILLTTRLGQSGEWRKPLPSGKPHLPDLRGGAYPST